MHIRQYERLRVGRMSAVMGGSLERLYHKIHQRTVTIAAGNSTAIQTDRELWLLEPA